MKLQLLHSPTSHKVINLQDTGVENRIEAIQEAAIPPAVGTAISDEPSSTASSREELAPGTPAQQSPPVVNVTPPPNIISPIFTFPPQRQHLHQQNSVTRMMAQTPNGFSGPPPPPLPNLNRPASSREEHRLRFPMPPQVRSPSSHHNTQILPIMIGHQAFQADPYTQET